MTSLNENTLFDFIASITDNFLIKGSLSSVEQNKKGYVNTTYMLQTTDNGCIFKYVLQHINQNVFKNINALIANYQFISKYFNEIKPDTGINVPKMVLLKNGECVLRDATGFWRMMNYFDNVFSVDIPYDSLMFYRAGRYFAEFIKELSDVPVDTLCEVIPNFHNTYKRYLDLEESISLDVCGRVGSVGKEIEFIRANIDKVRSIAEALETGIIPKRITHNDTNLNNILFDNDTGFPVAIIDLDTVMPSSALYDYGDSLRIGTNSARDDEKDLSKVYCLTEYYEAYTKGWLEVCGKVLTENELGYLPMAPMTITMEDGIRFLNDYISGDTYYKISYPTQNLDRSRTQLVLAEDMFSKQDKLLMITKDIYLQFGLRATLL